MRFQIKKLLEGYDPADLIEQSMYCFGSDDGGGDGSAGEENAIAGELDRSDVVDVSNVSNSDNYDAQFTADNLQDRGLNPSNFMSADNFAQTTQGGASDPYALNDEAYASMGSTANNVAQNLANAVNVTASPITPVAIQNVPSYAEQQNLANMSFAPQGALDRNYNVNYTPAIDLSFPQRLTNMFSNAYLGESVYDPVPSSISVTEAGKNYSPVSFTPEFTNKEEESTLADVSTDLATSGQAFAPPANIPQVDSLINANLGSLPQSSGAGSAPVVMQTAPTFDNSDFNFANSKSAENLQNMANLTGGLMPVVDTVVGTLSGARGTLDALNRGFVPEYDKDGNIVDVKDISFGSNQTEGYIGSQSPALTNIYGNDNTVSGNASDFSGDNSSPTVVTPMQNPVSGQPVCPDGYRFDDDLQACRMDTSRPFMPSNPNPFPSGDAYYRATSLDQAPMNVPSGFDFNKANQNFISQFAYRPANFTNQMGLSGFTPFRRS